MLVLGGCGLVGRLCVKSRRVWVDAGRLWVSVRLVWVSAGRCGLVLAGEC